MLPESKLAEKHGTIGIPTVLSNALWQIRKRQNIILLKLGENANVVVDRFVFDPKKSSANVVNRICGCRAFRVERDCADS
jgi:hypothetical protein